MLRAGLLVACCAACGFSVGPAAPPDGTIAPPDVSTDAPEVSTCNVVEIDAGGEHTCARLDDGTVHCWGRGANGELGMGLPTMRCTVGASQPYCSPSPVQVAALPAATGLGLGQYHTCAATADGTYCWGLNTHGAYGDGTSGAGSGQLFPRLIAERAAASSIAGGSYHTCSISSGSVACSGQNAAGEVGTGSLTPVHAAVVVLSGGNTVALGDYTSCTIDDLARLQCWGRNTKAQIDGSQQSKLAPTLVAEMTNVKRSAVGRDHVCAVFADGTAKCAGSNLLGQLGTGSIGADVNLPVTVTVPGLVDISAERNHTCVLDTSGAVRCFGEGYGAAPVHIQLPLPARAITSGSLHDCAITMNGEAYCWGNQDYGQLGDGVASPTRVLAPKLVALCS